MRHTLSISLDNRFGEVERVIGLLSGSGFKIEKMVLSESDSHNMSKFAIVVEANDKNVANIIIRIKQLIRVESVETSEGDLLPASGAVSVK